MLLDLKRSLQRRNVENRRRRRFVTVHFAVWLLFFRQCTFVTAATTSSPYLSSVSSSSRNYNPTTQHKVPQRGSPNTPWLFQPLRDWYSTRIQPTLKDWPKIQCRMEPTTTLKIRKTFRPLKTIARLSAHYNTQLGVWQFQSSWEDAIIGGKFTLAGRKELQFTKSWSLTGGSLGGSGDGAASTGAGGSATHPSLDDMVTRLRLRAAVDLQTWKAYVRVGVRTEQRSAATINVMEGFTVVKRLPLDGPNGQCKLEIKANFALPEPEIEYSTETHRSLVGMGDIEVGIEELNLLLDY
jgi:hypothetical protein